MNSVILVAQGASSVGDLFTELMGDYLSVLGYGDFRFNVPKPGREVDIEATHRAESKIAVAECKATKKKVGGDLINKFYGVLNRERAKRRRAGDETQVVGYFFSLYGFTETALDQEDEVGSDKVILVDGDAIVEELIRGRVVASRDSVAKVGGSCLAFNRISSDVLVEGRLLGSEEGWYWLICYRVQSGKIAYITMLHSDGHPMPEAEAFRILSGRRASEADTSSVLEKLLASTEASRLASLGYLWDDSFSDLGVNEFDSIKRLYLDHLAVECGFVELDGLPSDEEMSRKTLRLEKVFTPLRLRHADTSVRQGALLLEEPDRESKRISVGSILSDRTRVAVLGLPGSGKTTLLKRIAISYAFHGRIEAVGDELPPRPWFPLFLRCRELVDATLPITDIVANLARSSELDVRSDDFLATVEAEMRQGKVLLLIDGLDEISDPRARLAFVRQIKRFLTTYRKVSLIVTSREAGFREVAGAIADICTKYTVAELDKEDISKLVVAWHREVVGDQPNVIKEAQGLALSICENERIRRLAENPLLLTTLLLVKRWVGQLPRRRTVVYEKALEVLLSTWNIHGHESLDLEEVVPQLSFLAWEMMIEGKQAVSASYVSRCLRRARRAMPDILYYSEFGPQKLLERVELRSSILIMSGQIYESGKLLPSYEFRHLTFQEYLAANAAVEGYFEESDVEASLARALGPHVADPSWQEVIRLAALLSGRRAGQLVEEVAEPQFSERDSSQSFDLRTRLLVHFLFDGVQINPRLVQLIVDRVCNTLHSGSLVAGLLASKYSKVVCERSWDLLKEMRGNPYAITDAIRVISQEMSVRIVDIESCVLRLRELAESNYSWDSLERLMALALAKSYLSGESCAGDAYSSLAGLFSDAMNALQENMEHVQFVAVEVLGALVSVFIPTEGRLRELCLRIILIWTEARAVALRREIEWLLVKVHSLGIELGELGGFDALDEQAVMRLKAASRSNRVDAIEFARIVASSWGKSTEDIGLKLQLREIV